MSAWHGKALAALLHLAVEKEKFTADDLIAVVGHPDGEHVANGRNNAVGSVFREAKAAGIIEPTGEYRKSEQPKRKGGMVLVWRGTRPGTLF